MPTTIAEEIRVRISGGLCCWRSGILLPGLEVRRLIVEVQIPTLFLSDNAAFLLVEQGVNDHPP